jgi:hypothetical protein
MKVVWKDDRRMLRMHECLTTLAIYRSYRECGDDYLTKVDVNTLPYVVKSDIRNTTPAAVFDMFTTLYGELVGDLDSILREKEAMMSRIKEGSWDPVEDIMRDKKMKNAVGVFLQRKYVIVERMTQNEAYDKARENLSKACADMKSFMGSFMSHAAMNLMEAVTRYDLKDKKAVSALRPKVLGLDWEGLIVRIDVDDETIMLNDAEDEEPSADNSANEFDISYG